MRVVVVEHHGGGRRQTFEGSEADVRNDLLAEYPWLARKLGRYAAVPLLVKALDAAQAFTAVLQDADLELVKADPGVDEPVVAAMLGHQAQHEALLAAAAFLAGHPLEDSTRASFREALLREDEDPARAALSACGMDPTPTNVETLRLIAAFQMPSDDLPGYGTLNKAEQPGLGLVVAVSSSGRTFEEAVTRAAEAGTVAPIKLDGKHSAGSMLAYDPETDERILLKPGAGKQSPAAGARESGASQSKREAAFWQVAALWGLQDYVPEAHLLLVGGAEYAAIRLLPFTFKTALEAQQADPGLPRRLFHLFLPDGTLHRWAALDYVLGQTDRHAGNIMVRGQDVKLIDQGSALAGGEFAPASDRFTFVPFYLRALAPADFGGLPPEGKLHALPRLGAPAEAGLKTWLLGLDATALGDTLLRYGIDPDPSRRRLQDLQAAAGHTPADLAINGAWVLP